MSKHIIEVRDSMPSVIEFDHSVRAWYIRCTRNKVVKTLHEEKSGALVNIDLDAQNRVVGIELLGVREFSISALRRLAPIASKINLNRARFVPAGHVPEEAPA